MGFCVAVNSQFHLYGMHNLQNDCFKIINILYIVHVSFVYKQIAYFVTSFSTCSTNVPFSGSIIFLFQISRAS